MNKINRIKKKTRTPGPPVTVKRKEKQCQLVSFFKLYDRKLKTKFSSRDIKLFSKLSLKYP